MEVMISIVLKKRNIIKKVTNINNEVMHFLRIRSGSVKHIFTDISICVIIPIDNLSVRGKGDENRKRSRPAKE